MNVGAKIVLDIRNLLHRCSCGRLRRVRGVYLQYGSGCADADVVCSSKREVFMVVKVEVLERGEAQDWLSSRPSSTSVCPGHACR